MTTGTGPQHPLPSPSPRHRRIRPFNTRDTYPEQNLANDLCQAVVAGNLVFLRGQVGQDLETGASVGLGDVAAQTERAMANVALLLGEAGAELTDICKIVVYLVDPRYREPVYQVIGRWLRASTRSRPGWSSPPWPARSGWSRSMSRQS